MAGQESARKKRRQQLCSLSAAKLKTKSCPRDTFETISFTEGIFVGERSQPECEMFAHKDWLPLDLSRIVNSQNVPLELWAPSLGQLFCSGLFDAYYVPTTISRPRTRRQFHFGKGSTQKLLPLQIRGKLASLTAAFTQLQDIFSCGNKAGIPERERDAHPARSGSQSVLKLNSLHLDRSRSQPYSKGCSQRRQIYLNCSRLHPRNSRYAILEF